MTTIKASVLREQLTLAHKILDDTFAGITESQAHWQPSGSAQPIAAHYAHVVVQEDRTINLLKGCDPLVASSFAGKAGLSELLATRGSHPFSKLIVRSSCTTT